LRTRQNSYPLLQKLFRSNSTPNRTNQFLFRSQHQRKKTMMVLLMLMSLLSPQITKTLNL